MKSYTTPPRLMDLASKRISKITLLQAQTHVEEYMRFSLKLPRSARRVCLRGVQHRELGREKNFKNFQSTPSGSARMEGR